MAEGIEIAKMIEPYADIIHVSAGTYQRSFGDTHPSMFKEHGCNVYMARALLADPELPRKVVENRDEEIVRCLRCFTCMAERAATATRRCTVNPLIGREMDGVEIRLNTGVTPEYAEKEEPDALIIAVGSRPLVPPIKGLDGDNVVIVNHYYLEKEKVGDEVVVFGGGLAGCECAIHLGMEGRKVHLVEMREELAPDANVRHRPLLLKEIEKYVTVHTSYKGLEVTKEGIVCQDPLGNHMLVPGKSVICALGQRSRSELADALKDCAPYVRVIGDAAKVSTITNAVYWGYYAALDI